MGQRRSFPLLRPTSCDGGLSGCQTPLESAPCLELRALVLAQCQPVNERLDSGQIFAASEPSSPDVSFQELGATPKTGKESMRKAIKFSMPAHSLNRAARDGSFEKPHGPRVTHALTSLQLSSVQAAETSWRLEFLCRSRESRTFDEWAYLSFTHLSQVVHQNANQRRSAV